MIMLVDLECTLAQTRMGKDRVILPSKVPIRGQDAFLMEKSKLFIGLLFSVSTSGDSASYFIEMIMLMSLECILAKTTMGFGRVTLPSKGPKRVQYVFIMAKCHFFYMFSIFH